MSSPVSLEKVHVKLPKTKPMKNLDKKSIVCHSLQDEVDRLKSELQNMAGANKALNCQIEQLKKSNYLMKSTNLVKEAVSTQTEVNEDPFLQSLAIKLERLYDEYKPVHFPHLDYKTSSWRKCHKAIEGIEEMLGEAFRHRRRLPVDYQVPIRPKWGPNRVLERLGSTQLNSKV